MWYKLNGKMPVPCTLNEVSLHNRRVAWDEIEDIAISTVFIHLDHNYGEGPPLLFETMIFGGKHSEYQERYSTWEEAEAGHKHACDLVKSSLKQVP